MTDFENDRFQELDNDLGLGDVYDPLDQIALPDEGTDTPRYDPDEMLPMLSDSDSQHRLLAARAFCEIQDERAIPYLIPLLTDPSLQIRACAAYALGHNPSDLAVEPLIDQFHREPTSYVRKGLVWALGNYCDARAIPALVQAIKTDSSPVRLWAASALGRMGQVSYDAIIKAMPTLIEVMRQDEVAEIRSNCAWSVGQLCKDLPSNVVYATAIDALIETFAEDEDLGVRADARASLLGVGDARGLQVIEELERDDWFV
jgi:HEAT repeat protein